MTTCVFDKNGTLINIGEWDIKLETNEETGETIERNPLPSGAYTEEREVFVGDDGGLYIAKDPLTEAERWIAKHFSTARLLQMKVWWDDLPHEDTPKLADVFNWTANITAMAAGGSTDFAPPPHDFSALVQECVLAAQQLGRITQY